MKKKIFSCLLALIMVISLLPMTVAAAEDPVPEEQIPAPATGPISEDSPSPDEEGASTLTAGETYWFDLSAIAETLPGVPNEGFFGSGSISRPSQPLPEQTMHWVPFTYTGEFSAYVLNESSAGVKESSEQASTTEESSGTYGYTYPHRIFVSEYNLRRETSWNALKESGLLFGTSYSSENLTYTLRSLTGGSLGANYNVTEVSPANNEWDILMAMGMIKNFGTDYSVTQDTCSNSWYNSNFIVLRGITNSHQGFEITNTYTGATMNDNYPRASFRPVLEIPSDISNSEFHPVELDLNGGKLTTHENYSLADITNLNIVVKSKQSYTAPTATYFAAPTADAVFLYWEDGAGTHYDGGDSVPATVDKLTAIWGHTVTQNLTDVVSTNSATVTARGEAYTTTLSIAGTAPAGSQMTVSVSMGGTAIENAYNAETGVVAISNVNGPITITASATVTPVYGITASPASLPFGTVNTGYTQPEAQTVTITNTGNQELTVALPTTSANYIITPGSGFTSGSATLAVNATATFTVQPVAGLAAGTYDETLTVSGTNSTAATVALSFTVRSSTGGGSGSGTTRYTITAEAGRGGSISPSGRVSVSRGDDQTFRITASDDYEIADVLVDGDSVGAVSRYTFENVRANHTIEVVFEAAQLVADPDDTGVSGWLNTTDHMAYLNGFTDGSFGPDRQMTRGQAAQMFYNLLLVTDVPVTTAFTDVPDDMWCATAVNTLASLGIIQGFSDGTFRPDQNITRAQFAVIAMRFTNETPAGTIRFSDVDEDDWFYTQVTGAAQYGWIGGFSDGTFRPYDSITRAQVTAIVNRMLGRSADTAYVDRHVDELRQFSDVEETYWAYYLIMEATNDHNYSKDAGTESWTGLL